MCKQKRQCGLQQTYHVHYHILLYSYYLTRPQPVDSITGQHMSPKLDVCLRFLNWSVQRKWVNCSQIVCFTDVHVMHFPPSGVSFPSLNPLLHYMKGCCQLSG